MSYDVEYNRLSQRFTHLCLRFYCHDILLKQLKIKIRCKCSEGKKQLKINDSIIFPRMIKTSQSVVAL